MIPASHLAVSLMLGQDVTLAEAAACFGLSRQAVHHAWRRLLGDLPTPVERLRARRRVEVARLAADGASFEDAMRALGLSRGRTRLLTRSTRVVLRPLRDLLNDQMRIRLRRAVTLVASGLSLGEACRVAVVRHDTLRKACRHMGIRSSARSGRRDGRGGRAAELARSGLSVAEAAQQEGCAPQTVRAILARDQR